MSTKNNWRFITKNKILEEKNLSNDTKINELNNNKKQLESKNFLNSNKIKELKKLIINLDNNNNSINNDLNLKINNLEKDKYNCVEKGTLLNILTDTFSEVEESLRQFTCCIVVIFLF